MKRISVIPSSVKIGDIIQFKYDQEIKNCIVLDPESDGKLHAFALDRVNDVVVNEYFLKFKGRDVYDDLVGQFGKKSYRTYFINKMLYVDVLANADMTYTNPNFDYEWGEAQRYPEFEEMGKDEWIRIASEGYRTTYAQIKDKLSNVDLNFDSLVEYKKQNFYRAGNQAKVEMPIAVKFSDDSYDLLAGNTRLAGLVQYEINPYIWVVDISDLSE
jgi:hypothetical protein